MLTKEELKGIADIQTEEVLVPEWRDKDGNASRWQVRGMSVKERDSFEQGLVEAKRKGAKLNMSNMRARLVVRCVVDTTGQLYFTESDADWLGEKSAAAVGRLYDVASRLSGMSASDLEDIEKNLQSIPPEASS